MSLLEDLFLQDEANEAQELERIIEGDEYDDRPRSPASNSDENSAKEDEAEEDKRRVDPANAKTKRVVKNPRFILNPARLTGPRGIEIIPEHFKDFKFKGKGHEKEDLDLVLKILEHWAYRLYPKFAFEDCLKKIEILGKKRPVMVHLQKIRSDQLKSEDTVQSDSSNDEDKAPPEEDEFDKLLQQQIEIARATPAPESAKKSSPATPRHVVSQFTMPKATSSPSISEEQKERMLRNRKLAEERRLARLKQISNSENPEIGTIRLNTLHERMSNENSDSSDEEHHANVSVLVEINTKSNDKANENDKDEIMCGKKVNEQEIGEKELGVEETNGEGTTINCSTHTENHLLSENERTIDNSIQQQKRNSEFHVEHNSPDSGEDISANIENTKHEVIGVMDNSVINTINEKCNVKNDICEHKPLTCDNTCNNPEVMEDDNTSLKGVENVCNDTESNSDRPSKNAVTEVITNVDALADGVSAEKLENVENGRAHTANIVENAEIDKLVETELMDVDFDDEF